MHPKVKRIISKSICLGCFALFAVVMVYGRMHYPSAPIRLRDDGHYRDKHGQEFTEAQFHSFTNWERCFISSFVVFAAACIPLAVSQYRQRIR